MNTNLRLNEFRNSSQDSLQPLDQHHLLQGSSDTAPIKAIHRDWFLHQAILLAQMKNVQPAIQHQLKLAILHGYSKISTMDESQCERVGFQSSPFLPESCRYHRNTPNEMISKVDEAYAKDLGFQLHELRLIDNPLISEVLAREFPYPELNLKIDTLDEIEVLLDRLFKDAVNAQFPNERVLIDITQLLHPMNVNVKQVKKIVSKIEDLLVKRLDQLPAETDREKINQFLLSKLHLIAYVTYKEQSILLFPEFFLDPQERFSTEINQVFNSSAVRNRHGVFDRQLNQLMGRSGYRLCPIQAKSAWLKVEEIDAIFNKTALPLTSLAKPISSPKICKNYEDFITQPVVLKFRKLSQREGAPPYLKIIPEATFKLLEGLAYHKEIDRVYEQKGLGKLLQISYFRILNAMNEAIYKRNDFAAFNNQIELIHQEIQDILIILQPHQPQTLEKSVVKIMTQGAHPTLPSTLPTPEVYLKASAMHGFASLLSSIEAQKGTNTLQVAVSKASYYFQSDETLKQTKTYQVSVLDGDRLNQGDVSQAFDSLPTQPLDLFVTEFHHNIQASKQCYQPEDILSQVKAMYKANMFAKQFTVLIDTTIDLQQSKDVQAFFADPLIQRLITKGKLNAVLIRSAQKFDMLGMDNYYGGIVATIHKGQFFNPFDKRMKRAEDQLTGICYQGLAHLQKYTGKLLDAFREAIMENTQKLYRNLPSDAIYYEGSENPMQISQIKDNRLCFLDVKFPNYPKAFQAFQNCFIKFAREMHLPFAVRPSFGFSHTTLTLIDRIKFRLNVGLEGENILNEYALFFKKVQHGIEKIKKSKKMSIQEHDCLIAEHIAAMSFK